MDSILRMMYVPQKDGTFKEYLYHGVVKRRADALHIRTKTLIDGKMVEGGESILYVGYSEPGNSTFILGVLPILFQLFRLDFLFFLALIL